jgi:hypothetical protein
MAFHERRYAGLVLRLAGLALLALATLIGRCLFAAPDPAARTSALAYLLASLWMISACAGAALATLGRHLFDRVELSARWTVHAAPRDRSAELAARDAR